MRELRLLKLKSYEEDFKVHFRLLVYDMYIYQSLELFFFILGNWVKNICGFHISRDMHSIWNDDYATRECLKGISKKRENRS